MIDRRHDLPVCRQAQLVGISRGTVYYHSESIPESDLRLLRRIDELHLEHPFAGSRMLRDMLRQERQRRASACGHADAPHGHRGDLPQAPHEPPAPGAPIYRYLLRGLAIERAN